MPLQARPNLIIDLMLRNGLFLVLVSAFKIEKLEHVALVAQDFLLFRNLTSKLFRSARRWILFFKPVISLLQLL